MNIHIATLNGLHVPPEDYAFAVAREKTINAMAYHLMAGAAGSLDLESENDCIRYLLDTEERWRWRDIKDHFDAAVYLAKQTIIQAAMSLR
jgi:hypothetical protein